MEAPIIKIECDWAEGGFRYIEEQEFDSATMKLFVETKTKASKKAEEK